MDVEYKIEGTGYVYEQSIKKGEKVKDKIVLKLKEKYQYTICKVVYFLYTIMLKYKLRGSSNEQRRFKKRTNKQIYVYL